jgi:hypothetical protein
MKMKMRPAARMKLMRRAVGKMKAEEMAMVEMVEMVVAANSKKIKLLTITLKKMSKVNIYTYFWS